MARPFKDLPPLTALSTFEAAARHGSFKLAAEELNVTAGAVSHQIKALEQLLDIDLFHRRHRGVELTAHGETLADVMHRSLSDIASTLDQISKADDDASVTIGATTATSSLWLTPRLSSFWKQHGNIPVNQKISDTQAGPDGVTDFVVRYGEMRSADPTHHLLFEDRLIPLCSPSFADKHRPGSRQELANLPLIHLGARDTDWTSWHTWFSQLNYNGKISTGIIVNNYTIALQAARDDLGLVLGWQKLVHPLLESGELVRFGKNSLKAPGSFYIHTQDPNRLSPNASTVLNWLLQSI